MKSLDVIAAILLVIGGLNWGLVGLFNVDVIATLFGGTSLFSKTIYTAVGAAALYQAIGLRGIQYRWGVQTA